MFIKNSNGMSLLEAMISMIILSLGLFGLAPLIVLSVESNNISQDMSNVSSLAKEKLEYFSDPEMIPSYLPYKEIEEGTHQGYHRITYIWDNSTDTTLPDGIYNINVAIAWRDKTGVNRLSEFTSTVYKE